MEVEGLNGDFSSYRLPPGAYADFWIDAAGTPHLSVYATQRDWFVTRCSTPGVIVAFYDCSTDSWHRSDHFIGSHAAYRMAMIAVGLPTR